MKLRGCSRLITLALTLTLTLALTLTFTRSLTLPQVKRYWDAELAAEGMMHLALPAAPQTNGSWLAQQAGRYREI